MKLHKLCARELNAFIIRNTVTKYEQKCEKIYLGTTLTQFWVKTNRQEFVVIAVISKLMFVYLSYSFNQILRDENLQVLEFSYFVKKTSI